MVYEKYTKTTPGTEIVTVSEMKDYLKVDNPDENNLIQGLLDGWFVWLEGYCWSSFNETTWKLDLSEWYDPINVRRGPVKAVTSVTYYDNNNVQQTLASTEYSVLFDSTHAVIEVDSFPILWDRPDAVTINFTAENIDAIPAARLALMSLVGMQYLQREDFNPESPYISMAKRIVSSIRLNYFY